MKESVSLVTRRRLLGSVATVAGASAAAGAGTMAYFSDSESSDGNTIQAGTLELGFDGSSAFGFDTALAPTQTTEESVILVSSSSIDGSLDVDVSYTESDADTGGTDVNDDEVAQNLEIVTLDYGDDDQDVRDQISAEASPPTLYDLANNKHGADESTENDLINLPDPGEGTPFTVGLRLRDVGDNFQGDGVTVTFEFILNQHDDQ